MKAVIIKVLIALLVTYLGVSFVDWDLQWYERLALLNAGDRFLLGIFFMLISLLMYCLISLIDTII